MIVIQIKRKKTDISFVKSLMRLQKIGSLNISLTRIQMFLIKNKIYGMNFR